MEKTKELDKLFGMKSKCALAGKQQLCQSCLKSIQPQINQARLEERERIKEKVLDWLYTGDCQWWGQGETGASCVVIDVSTLRFKLKELLGGEENE